MDRRSLIKNAGLAGVLAAGVAPAVHAQAAIRWRLASSFPKSLDTIYGAAEVFSKAVKAMSGGKFEISVHAAGELMPAFGVVDGVQQGSVECAHTAPYYFFGKDETFALGCAIPFVQPELIPFLPLNITIFAEGEQSILVSSHPSTLRQFFPDPALGPVFDRWENDLGAIMDELREDSAGKC